MEFVSKAKYVRFSPYKLRALADVIRGKGAAFAIQWLSNYPVKRSIPLKKAVESAIANAKQGGGGQASDLVIKEIKIDEGPIVRYYKPGAMGRSNVYRKRLSHISVVLKPIEEKGV